jgi:hypothetical protein
MCVARFARDNAYSAAPTALPRHAEAGATLIINVPALPGWADVWRTALRASTMRYPHTAGSGLRFAGPRSGQMSDWKFLHRTGR